MPTNFSSGVVAYGSIISYATFTNMSSGTVGTYNKVAQSVDLDSPLPEVGDINLTNNDSPNNTKEYFPGMVEPGDLDFDVVFFASAHVPILNMVGNQIIYSWKETFTDGTTCVFPGYVKSAGVTGKTENEALKGKIKVKLTGAAVYTAGAGADI